VPRDIPEEQRLLCFSSERKVLIILSFQHETNAYNFDNNPCFLKSELIYIMKKCFPLGQTFQYF